MKQNKFRIWDTGTKKMIYPMDPGYDDIDIFLGGDGKLYQLTDNGACGDPECCGDRYNFMRCVEDRFIPMMCTDLKDKTGREIYEGDIINILENTYLVEIVWNYETAAFAALPVGAIKEKISEHLYGAFMHEVIGNICENPQYRKFGTESMEASG